MQKPFVTTPAATPYLFYTILYEGPLQRYNQVPKGAILFAGTILFNRTILFARFYGNT